MNNLVYNPNTKTVHSSTTIVNSQQLLSVNSPVYKGAYTPYTHSSPTPQNPSSVGGHSGKVLTSGSTFSVLGSKLSSAFSSVSPVVSTLGKSVLKYAPGVGLLYSAYDQTKNVYESAVAAGTSLNKLYDDFSSLSSESNSSNQSNSPKESNSPKQSSPSSRDDSLPPTNYQKAPPSYVLS